MGTGGTPIWAPGAQLSSDGLYVANLSDLILSVIAEVSTQGCSCQVSCKTTHKLTQGGACTDLTVVICIPQWVGSTCKQFNTV